MTFNLTRLWLKALQVIEDSKTRAEHGDSQSYAILQIDSNHGFAESIAPLAIYSRIEVSFLSFKFLSGSVY
jgi:hypothetical protein